MTSVAGSTFAALVPARGDRVMFAGQTGSGKTTLARVLLSTRRYVVALDTKGMLRWPEYRVYTSLDKLRKATEERLIYRPPFHVAEDDAEREDFFRWIYLRRNCTCYVDELMQATRGEVYPRHFGAGFTRGRELGVEMWTSTQRPVSVPQVSLSESEHVYAFRLRLPQDRDRVEALAGIDAERIARLPKHHFLYSRQDADVIGPLRLAL
jgi:hypothetical protein